MNLAPKPTKIADPGCRMFIKCCNCCQKEVNIFDRLYLVSRRNGANSMVWKESEIPLSWGEGETVYISKNIWWPITTFSINNIRRTLANCMQ